MTEQLIFQMGTNNWQRGGEFAPGSGILHEAHHRAFAGMTETASYSMYPSSVQSSDDPAVRILELDHEVPICESISPVSSYRFHSMSDGEFNRYRNRLQQFAEDAIAAAEAAEGVPVSIAIAHHSFLNPLILSDINRKRIAEGRPRFRLLCFVHGTALKMFSYEQAGTDSEYPRRFLPMMAKAGVFSAEGEVDVCAAISHEQIEKFQAVFSDYPRSKMVLSQNGYSSSVFNTGGEDARSRREVLAGLVPANSPVAGAPTELDADADRVVMFCGKFADWKRLDALLHAAKDYENRQAVTTLIVGSGPEDAIEHYHRLAYEELGLKRTYFLGPRPQPEIAELNRIADVGVYPSRNEPFGLVFIECMACGTPVIGADSGGPRDFVTDDVGGLVPEAEGVELIESLRSIILTALDEDWKASKGPAAAGYAKANFSIDRQCEDLIAAFEGQKPFAPTSTSQ